MSSSSSSPRESSHWASDSDSPSFLSEEEDINSEDEQEAVVSPPVTPKQGSCRVRTASQGSFRLRAFVPATPSEEGQAKSQGPGPRVSFLRPRRARKPSQVGGPMATGSTSARAYAEALRSTRMAGHRGSVSMASRSGSLTPSLLSEDTKRRHRDSKKRMECTDRTQLLLFQAHALEEQVQDLPLRLLAAIIPPRWRVQIMEHVTPIVEQMSFCRDRVIQAWKLLLPPFDRANLNEYERRLKLCEQAVGFLDTAMKECEAHVVEGEQLSACRYVQSWYRKRLAKRGFYTKVLRISRHHRGLIPGMFDTIAGQSKLTIHRRTQEARLEYPKSSAVAKHAFPADSRQNK
ncbi:hypothetical protein Poli38472_008659 [Pythium oligandrum]|uniref:Uncharacterized protein n=1 Tax=Pythium oligandrum TaxID=41045 RepID=A0A8K1FBD7_PYTOL|nr:hypothetical protein Poli38472_008659 [Pythium oligandrum]|eukprot:TMW56011.1 hypothetical protein Poli38472_008659 [Pythium oligandrum]